MHFKHPKDWQHLDLRIAFSPLGRKIPVMFCIIKKAIMFFLSRIVSQFAVNKKEQTQCLNKKITLWGTYFCVSKNTSLNIAFKVQHKAKSLFCNSGNWYLFWLPHTFHYKIALQLGSSDTIIHSRPLKFAGRKSCSKRNNFFFFFSNEMVFIVCQRFIYWKNKSLCSFWHAVQ